MRARRRWALLGLFLAVALTITACASGGPAHVSVYYGYGYGPGWGYGWPGSYRPPRPIGPPPGHYPRPVQLPETR